MTRPRTLVIHHTGIEGAEQASSVEKSHEKRGYGESTLHSHIAYHFLIGKDGTVKQNRSLSERSGHTRNQETNTESIAIVLAGNFNNEHPSEQQLKALRSLVNRLDSLYGFEQIIPHREASPTACPGKHLYEALKDLWRGEEPQAEPWNITRYYTPEHGQLRYYHGSYEKDFEINCSGDCLVTADGYRMKPEDAFKVAACPPEIPFGTKIEIQGIGVVTCHDRGGAIKQKRLDVWAGVGMEALRQMKQKPGGYLSIKILKDT